MMTTRNQERLILPRRGEFRAVLFDLDGTLRLNRPAGFDVFYNVLGSYGLKIGEAQRRQATRWVHAYWADSDDLHADMLEAGGSMARLYRRFADRHMAVIGIDRSRRLSLLDVVSSRMRDEYRPESVVPDGVPAMLESLAQAGYRLGLISNREVGLRESSENHDLSRHFELILEAGEVRRWKPHPAIFWEALQRMGVEASDSVYVGDNFFADVIGARAAGLQSILVDPGRIFPEADCPVVDSVTEIPSLLNGRRA